MEDERRRIARELHDGVTQTLSGLVRGLELVRRDVDAPAATGIEHMRTAAQEALSDIRRVSRDLRPATLDDLGLLPAIESLVAELGERSGVEATLHSTGAVQTLTGAQQLCIFRIVQEALSNVERHARASTVEVGCVVDGRNGPAARTRPQPRTGAEATSDGPSGGPLPSPQRHGRPAGLRRCGRRAGGVPPG